MGWGWGWRPYVPAAQKKARAAKWADKMKKEGKTVSPVRIEGRKIATSFWGKGWCDHMESFHDFENRLPRGRTYVRNGSVVHLEIAPGKIKAYVAGTDTYTVEVGVKPLPPERWEAIKKQCAGQIASLVDLLQGRLSDGVMRQVACRDGGLFPHPKELEMECSCPDWAEMCKHVAAVCYGVGARLDETPELLFRLRGVDHEDLVAAAGVAAVLDKGVAAAGRKRVEGDLSEVFGIDLADAGEPLEAPTGAADVPDSAPADPGDQPPRPRGRPRKVTADIARISSSAKKSAAAKKKRRGRRPVKHAMPPATAKARAERLAMAIACLRGKPRKAAIAALLASLGEKAVAAKREKPRGRKPVKRSAPVASAKTKTDAVVAPAKRPRGRPRKTATAAILPASSSNRLVVTKKKPRGRKPVKPPAPPSTVKVKMKTATVSATRPRSSKDTAKPKRPRKASIIGNARRPG